MNEQQELLKNFVFDVLGDMADPRAFKVVGRRVILLYPGLLTVSKEVLLAEWNYATRGTDFEGVEIYTPLEAA